MEMETITTAIGTAITSLSTNIQTMIGTNLPALLGVAAIFIAIPAVWGLVKRPAGGGFGLPLFLLDWRCEVWKSPGSRRSASP